MQTATAEREVIISRTVNAPRELVFKVWTDPQHLINWWGPKGFTNTFHEINVVPGGVWRFTMHAPDGTDFPNRVVFKEITAPEKIIYSHGTDEEPDQFIATIQFEEKDGKTKITLQSLFPTKEARDRVVEQFHAIEGGEQHLDKMEQHLATLPEGKDELLITRELNAPQSLVFRVWSEGEHLAKWWGPAEFDMMTKTADVRPGGLFHYRMTTPDGNEIWGRFIFGEIKPSWKIEFTNSFADEEGNIAPNPWTPEWPLEISNTVIFKENNGKTTLILRGKPINATEEQMELFRQSKPSMHGGFKGTLDKLAAYLEKMV